MQMAIVSPDCWGLYYSVYNNLPVLLGIQRLWWFSKDIYNVEAIDSLAKLVVAVENEFSLNFLVSLPRERY